MIPRTGYHNVPGNPVEQLFWGRCYIERASAFSFYTRGSRIRGLIHCMKYRGIKEIGYELGRIYGSSLKSSAFTKGIDLIIPVPLHPDKRRMRGFNQSEIISEGISEATGLPLGAGFLSRAVSSSTQTRRSRYERWTNVEGIFRVHNGEALVNTHILLVDDVITTGSTLESCACELLKREGVKVSVAALAVAVV
jgi:ComF family protein